MANRINLIKYGFIRTPEEDFSDDGNRFQVYKLGNMRVSKLIADGDAYIAARYEGPNQVLSYDEYKMLPGYKELDKLNGVSASSVDDAALINLKNACETYEKAFKEAASKVVLPTADEIYNARKAVLSTRQAEFKIINERMSKDFSKVLCYKDEYAVRNFTSYYKSMKEYADESNFIKNCNHIVGTSYSRDQIKLERVAYDCQPGFYYKECCEYLDRFGL